jgi:hypothetical protein
MQPVSVRALPPFHGVVARRVPPWAAWLLACFASTGCELVKGIFKAGVWTGVLAVFAVIALVFYCLTKLARR